MGFMGFSENVLTFACDNTVKAGDAVKMKASETVTPAGDGDVLIGICLDVRNGYAAVQLSGYAEMEYSGTAPTVGYAKLASAGSGKVKSGTSGREYLVLNVNAASSTVGFIL